MAARIRGLVVALGLAVTLWATLPAGVMAECNGPACGPPETGVEGVQGALLIAVLVLFGGAMAVAEARRSRHSGGRQARRAAQVFRSRLEPGAR